MTVTVKARVVGVRPRADGTFGVTLGPGPDIFWFRAVKPPKLGQLVVIQQAEPKPLRVRGGVVTLLEDGLMRVEPDKYARRVVAPQWIRRTHQMMRRPLYPYQTEGAAWLASRLALRKGSILADDMGLGKGHPTGTRILTPNGWILIEELSVGDQVVGSDGNPVLVTGIFNRGKIPICKVSFSDKTSIHCDYEHLWAVQTPVQKMRKLGWKVKSVYELMNLGIRDSSGNRKWHIPILNKPVKFNSNGNFLIHPYIMGVLIGDGCRSNSSVKFSPGDYLVPRLVQEKLSSELHLTESSGTWTITTGVPGKKNIFLEELRKLKIQGLYSHQRFIPSSYLFGDVKSRIELLKGLMDTDGEGRPDGHLSYSTSSKKLSEDVAFLIESLGGVVRIRVKNNPVYTYKSERRFGRTSYILTISLPPSINPFDVFSDRYISKSKYLPSRLINSIEHVGEKEVICLKVNAVDSLYVTEHCIVTHNTAQVLAAILVTRCLPAIIVCPPSVKRNWAREAQYLRAALCIAIVNGRWGAIQPAHLIIVNYAILKDREQQLKRLGAKCIIYDEAHLLKSPTPGKSHRAAVATRISARIGRSIELTGTPLLNRPQEIWRLLHIVDPPAWPSYSDFRKRYCTAPVKEEDPGVNIMTKHAQAKHIEELRALAEPYILRRLKDEVLNEQLPPKQRRRVMVELEPIDRKNYDEAEKDVVAWLRNIGTEKRAREAARAQAIVKLTMLRKIAAIGKLRVATKKYIEAWFSAKRRPLIVFAYHRQVLAGVRNICKRKKLRYAEIRGSDNELARLKAIDAFQTGQADVFIGPLRSAGVGINLQRGSDILCLERLWTPALMDQAESRAHRVGQRRLVTVTYLDATRTVDDHIANVSEIKQVLIDKVVDDQDRELQKRVTIETIDEVISRMRRGL